MDGAPPPAPSRPAATPWPRSRAYARSRRRSKPSRPRKPRPRRSSSRIWPTAATRSPSPARRPPRGRSRRRDPIDATDRILRACTRPTLAEGALYSYSRGGSEVTGPSIRLAEALAQSWGNIQFGIRELEQRNGESTVEAYAWDLETNTRQVKIFQVGHVRHTKAGSKRLTDPRDIYEMVANQGARRLRACILGVIPGDVIEAAVKQCEETIHASADTGPDALKNLTVAFAEMGVTREQIEARIQCRLEAIRPAQIVQLRKIYASLRDGMSAVETWFDPIEPAAAEGVAEQARGTAGLKAQIGKRDKVDAAAPVEGAGHTTE